MTQEEFLQKKNRLREAVAVIAASPEGKVLREYIRSRGQVGGCVFRGADTERENAFKQGMQAFACELESLFKGEVAHE